MKKPHRRLKKNSRYRCTDCGGQFYERTQEVQMDVHCLKMGVGPSHRGGGNGWMHHGMQKVPGLASSNPQKFRRVSDSTDDMRRWVLEEGHVTPTINQWLAENR